MPALKLFNPQNSFIHRDYYHHPHFRGKGSGSELKTALKTESCFQGYLKQYEKGWGQTLGL